MNVNHITTVSSHFSQTQASNESAAQQLADLINQLRAAMSDPQKELDIINKIATLLSKDSSLIEQECALNGYKPGGEFDENYAAFLNQIVSMAHHIDGSNSLPTKGQIELINSMATQLHFLMVNPNPK